MAKQVYGEAGRDLVVAEIIRTGMRTRMERSWVVYERGRLVASSAWSVDAIERSGRPRARGRLAKEAVVLRSPRQEVRVGLNVQMVADEHRASGCLRLSAGGGCRRRPSEANRKVIIQDETAQHMKLRWLL